VRVVLDTNVLLAAFGTRGICEALLDACLAAHELYLSQAILDEVKEHLSGKFKMPSQQINQIVSFLKSACISVTPTAVATDACRDPDDLLVLGTAIAAHADCLVTGDKDLLVLGTHQGIAIVSPRSFWQRLK